MKIDLIPRDWVVLLKLDSTKLIVRSDVFWNTKERRDLTDVAVRQITQHPLSISLLALFSTVTIMLCSVLHPLGVTSVQ